MTHYLELSWWGGQDLNPRPRDYESPALTTELLARLLAMNLASVSCFGFWDYGVRKRTITTPEPPGKATTPPPPLWGRAADCPFEPPSTEIGNTVPFA